MADAIRFFFDQHMPIAGALRRHGADVLTAHEAGRCGLTDEEQLRFATAEGRAVVTHDADYLTLAADFLQHGEAFAGVVFCHPDEYGHDVKSLIRDLLILYGVMTADEMQNHVEYL